MLTGEEKFIEGNPLNKKRQKHLILFLIQIIPVRFTGFMKLKFVTVLLIN